MTEEVNAAILGALEAGAKESVVNDSHATMRNLLIEELHPQAQLVSGSPKPHGMMQGIDASFDAVFFTGYHAMAGTQDAVLDHSFSSACVRGIKLGNVQVGEAGMNAAMAGHFKVPVVFAAGDSTAVQQVKKLIPHLETVSVKEPIGRLATRSYQLGRSAPAHQGRGRARRQAGARCQAVRDPQAGQPRDRVAVDGDGGSLHADPRHNAHQSAGHAFKAKDPEQAYTVTVAVLALARSVV